MKVITNRSFYYWLICIIWMIFITGCNNSLHNISNSQIINGDFETGDLTGWTVVEGDAFSNETVVDTATFWDENIPFQHEGKYHLNGVITGEQKVGKLQSSTFRLSGDGTITFKMGAARDIEKTYVAVCLAKTNDIIFKQPNTFFLDPGIAEVSQYDKGLAYTNNYADYAIYLPEYIGQEMYLLIVDDDSDGDFGFINVDSIKTYYVDGVAIP
ncbi:hypothetical protein [Paenibacillus puerhi]|uniref:hypothetical protein n=1 Tax=Paenibacillus puerhi TaxID=2692622 RepID=UPI0013575F2D|nr:hypothetical protein [Paenibacillus puerhi]